MIPECTPSDRVRVTYGEDIAAAIDTLILRRLEATGDDVKDARAALASAIDELVRDVMPD